MQDKILSQFGNSQQRIKNALNAIKHGCGVLVLDDENRENEGDMIFSAENMTVSQMALAIRYSSGIICLGITESLRQILELPMMVEHNSSNFKTAFTVSIEAKYGVTTGVSASDRLKTIKTAIKNNAKPNDLNKPGHVFPLCAQEGGVLARNGHTEAAVDLNIMAGLKPTGVLCELTNDDGTMAKTNDIINFSKKHNMPIITIQDIICYKKYIK